MNNVNDPTQHGIAPDERITDYPISEYDCEQCTCTTEADVNDEYHMKNLCDDCAEFLWSGLLEIALRKRGLDIEECKVDTCRNRLDDTLDGFNVSTDHPELGYIEFHCIPCSYLWALKDK